MPEKERIYYLLQQQLTKQLTPRESAELQAMAEEPAVREVIQEMLVQATGHETTYAGGQNPLHAAGQETQMQDRDWDQRISAIVDIDKPAKRKPVVMGKKWWAAAAAVILIIGAAVVGRNKMAVAPQQAQLEHDVAPGGNRAILTLANGQTIILDSAHNGVITQQGNTKVVKLANDQLAYTEEGKTADILYNTMSTPRGGQYKLVLPDGTAVWLNAESSITYATSFAGEERSVTMTGEAYFEVVTDKRKPFRVNVNGMKVDVLGTHFNVNAYKDEEYTRTTLLEGGVRVSGTGAAAVVLQPGQQAKSTVNSSIEVIKDVDTDEAVAWKDGFFSYNNADIATVMRELSRWYNVDVEYEGEKPKYTFSGDIGRGLTLSQVLKALERTKVYSRIEGKRIIILP